MSWNEYILNNYYQCGLKPQMCESFPDFRQFLEANNIIVYFLKFDHKIVSIRGELALLYEGIFRTWTELKGLIFGFESTKNFVISHGYKYIDRGIVKQDLVRWSVLSPCWRDQDNPLPGYFFVELVTLKRGLFGFSRHSFLRLIDDQTNVYSIGFGEKNYK